MASSGASIWLTWLTWSEALGFTAHQRFSLNLASDHYLAFPHDHGSLEDFTSAQALLSTQVFFCFGGFARAFQVLIALGDRVLLAAFEPELSVKLGRLGVHLQNIRGWILVSLESFPDMRNSHEAGLCLLDEMRGASELLVAAFTPASRPW